MSLPMVTLEGGVVFLPDLKFSANGKAWARIRVACKDHRVRDTNGQWADGDATFVTVVCWGRLAENLAESVRVGDTITVAGHLAQREWTDSDGNKRTDYQVNAETVGVSLLWNPARTPKALEDTPEAEGAPAIVDVPFPF